EPVCPRAEHDATDLGAGVLQGEIAVAAGRAHEVRDLARDPERAEGRFDQAGDPPVEFGNAEDLAAAGREGVAAADRPGPGWWNGLHALGRDPDGRRRYRPDDCMPEPDPVPAAASGRLAAVLARTG